jgi:hypothetical protein
MDISTWTDSEILQLPDHFFGERRVVAVMDRNLGAGYQWEISADDFPTRSLVWQLNASIIYSNTAYNRYAMALGDAVPADQAAFNALTQLFEELGDSAYTPRTWYCSLYSANIRIPMKTIVETGGHNLILETYSPANNTLWIQVAFVVSEIPTEIKQWQI